MISTSPVLMRSICFWLRRHWGRSGVAVSCVCCGCGRWLWCCCVEVGKNDNLQFMCLKLTKLRAIPKLASKKCKLKKHSKKCKFRNRSWTQTCTHYLPHKCHSVLYKLQQQLGPALPLHPHLTTPSTPHGWRSCCRPIIIRTVQEYFWQAQQGQMLHV